MDGMDGVDGVDRHGRVWTLWTAWTGVGSGMGLVNIRNFGSIGMGYEQSDDRM